MTEPTTNKDQRFTVEEICTMLHVTRSAYYIWRKGNKSARELENEELATKIEELYEAHPDKGYRRIRDDLRKGDYPHITDSQVLRIERFLHIQSTIKNPNNCCTRRAANPAFTAENILDRKFYADAPNEKWLTDVTEFRYYINGEKRKLYLSAIFDLYHRGIVAFALSDHNDNRLVFENFDNAIKRVCEKISVN